MSIDGLISQIERARSVPRGLIGELRDRLRRASTDAITLVRAREAVARHGEELGLEAVWRPEIGSTYLLVVGGGGEAGRLRAHREGPAHARALVGLGSVGVVDAVFDTLTAALAREGRGVPEAEGSGHRIHAEVPGDRPVDGDSLGVALAVALVSRWSGRAPSARVAASASLGSDGRLGTIGGLEHKLRALRRRYPAVERVVVAKAQAGVAIEGLTLVPVETLRDALAAHELDLGEVPGTIDALEVRRQIDLLQYERVASYDPEVWRRHARRARWLAELAPSPTQRVRALGYAGLFHLHAGDSTEAGRLFATLDPDALAELSPGARVALRVNAASGAIDRDPEAAVGLARDALAEARALTGEARSDQLGRALGTFGRALVHAGRAEEAIEHLRAAVDHHAGEPREKAQSLVYLATGLRWVGAYQDALAAIEESLSLSTDATPLFARYERLRIRHALGDVEAMREDLEAIEAAQDRPTAYPRLGTLRYRVAFDLGRGALPSRQLEEACALAASLSGPLQSLALGAIAEARLSGHALSYDWRERLDVVWASHAAGVEPSAFLARLVY